jgi:ATP-binding cassette subfamily B protein
MEDTPANLTKQTLLYVWRHAWRYKHYVIGLLISVPLAILTLAFLPPIFVANILEKLNAGEFVHGNLWQSFGIDLLWYAGLTVMGSIVLWRIAIILIWKLEMRVIQDIHQEIFDHLMSLSANFHANRFGGSLVSQTNKLAGAYIRIADTTVFSVAGLLLSFVFTIVILAPKAPLIAIALIVFSLAFMICAVVITRKVRELNALEAAASNTQTGFLADAITNVLAVKSFGAGDQERKRYAAATETTKQATHTVMVASTKRDIFFASTTSVLTTGALILATASVTLWDADIAVIFLVVTYTGMISQRLWEFSQSSLRQYNRALGDARDMIKVLALEPDVKDNPAPEPCRINQGSISFDSVNFTHPESNDAGGLFQKLNLTIAPGEKIGLVGHSGSGKTSLTKLLLRFSDIDSGSIRIDGQNIADITQDDLRRSIAYVPQEPLLFHRSIRENIAYGRPGATEEAIIEAARKANAHDFVEKLTKGYDTLVGERGVKLSGGQRQRIAIARAILKDAPILVLDEATSALDSESEKLIQEALRELMKGRTAIVIAHRLSTVQKMDRILVLEDGRIIEQGSHAHLIKQQGVYAQLWAHQSGGFIEE